MSIQKQHHHSFSSFNPHFISTFNPYFRPPEEKEVIYSAQYRNNLQYFEEFKKLYFTAYCIEIQCKRIESTKQSLIDKLNLLEEKLTHEIKENQSEEPQLEKFKRFRRKADEIERKFVCTAERCGRNYGTQGSLQQHIKLKHLKYLKNSKAFTYIITKI